MTRRDEERGQRIREAREALNLTQVELAEQIGVAERTIKRWESGKTAVSAANAPLLELALGVSLNGPLAAPAATLEQVSDRLARLEEGQARILQALGLDGEERDVDVPQALATMIARLEPQVVALLQQLGAPDAARWLSTQPQGRVAAGGARRGS